MTLAGLLFFHLCISPTTELRVLGRPLLGRLGNVLNIFPLVNNLSHCITLNSKLFRNGFYNPFRIDVAYDPVAFPSWHCVNTQLTVPDQHSARTSAFILICTPADDQLIKGPWLPTPDCNFLSLIL